MAKAIDYRKFGGVPLAQGDGSTAWNFGRRIDAVAVQIVENNLAVFNGSAGSFHDLAPHLVGCGAGKTVVLADVARRVLGNPLQSQKQPRGTCVSRGAKRASDYCQLLAIAAGTPAKFEYISHAYIYGSCREHGGDLSNQDGAVGAWAAWSVANDGNLRNSDVQDDDNSDDLAVRWGARGVPSDIKAKGRLTVIRKVVPIRSFDEARDFICSGMGAITVASGVGYEGSRDKDGVIRRRGSWAHQMMYSGYRSDLDALLQEQSWGSNMPSGPCVLGQPDYSFWTLRQDAETQIGERDCFGFMWQVAFNELPDATWRP